MILNKQNNYYHLHHKVVNRLDEMNENICVSVLIVKYSVKKEFNFFKN